MTYVSLVDTSKSMRSRRRLKGKVLFRSECEDGSKRNLADGNDHEEDSLAVGTSRIRLPNWSEEEVRSLIGFLMMYTDS